MHNNQPALIVYGIAALAYFLSAMLGWESINYISKPLFIGAIIAHYLIESNGKVNMVYISIFLLMLTSAVINLFDYEDFFTYVLYANFITYVLLLLIVSKKIIRLKWQKIEKDILLSVLLMLIFLICLVYICVIIVFDETFALYNFLYLYNFVIIALAMCSIVLIQLDRSKENSYLFLTIITIIVCEFFYALFYFYQKLFFFRFVSILCYVLSFYFLVKFFLEDKKQTKII